MFKLALILTLAAAPLALADGPSFRWGDAPPGFSWGDVPASKWVWSSSDIPPQFRKYKSATMTQSIFKLYSTPTIRRVPRRSMEEKWRVPGGLVGVKGWKSDLYSWADGEEWVDDLPVVNSGGSTQYERGWTRSYSDGSEFLDVLSNTASGKVFEVRKAVKKDGHWQRFVTYRDPTQRPHGYEGPGKLDCRGCHEQAGQGSYGVGLPPGADTVFSDPLGNLEPNESTSDERPVSGSGTSEPLGRGQAVNSPLSGRSRRSAASC